MASGYKVRLPDGSEIGPLSVDELKDWFARGLIGKDSPVLRPGGSRWSPLRQVIKIESAAPKRMSPSGPSAELQAALREVTHGSTRAAGRGGSKGAAPDAPEEPTPRWRTLVAAVLLLVGAAGSVFWLLRPERWLAALDDTPWRPLALGLLALGLLLVPGWDLGRKLARVILVAACLALFPVAGILFAQNAPRTALAVVGSAFLLGLGLVIFLARGWLPAWHALLRLALVLAGGYGIARFGYVPEHPDSALIRERARPERSLDDAAHGARLVLPAGWVALGPGQTLVPVPGGSWAVLADTRLGGRARVTLQTAKAPLGAEELLSRALESRHLQDRSELERSDAVLGSVRGRRARSRFTQDGASYLDVTVAARDGVSCWTLSAWIPDDGSTRPAHELDALVAGLSLDGRETVRQASLLTQLTADLPFLDKAAAELVITGASAADQSTPRVLRRGLDLASRGRVTLSVAEAQELDGLAAAAVVLLPKTERERVATYLVRVRAGEATSSEDDAAVAPLFKRALLSLPDESLARLQALYEKAVRTAFEAGQPG